MLYIVVLIGALLVGLLAWGVRLPRTQYFSRDILINAPVEEVWGVVTNYLGQVKWRTDLHSVEIGDALPGSEEWVERPRRGAPTKLRVLRQRPLELLEVARSREGLCSGKWTATFEKAASATRLRFVESITLPNPVIRVLSPLFFRRSAAIEAYQRDLKHHVEKSGGRGVRPAGPH